MKAREFKRIRRQLGISQAVLARAIGVEQNTVWRWESGEASISEPVARLLRVIAGEDVPEIRFQYPEGRVKK